MSPAKSVRSLLSKVKAIEANNTMVTLGYKQFVGRSMIDVAPTLDTLKASSPATFEEYERRLARKKVVDFETVRTEWPTLKAQLLQNWQDSVDDNAAKIIGAKRQRVTKPTMPNAPALDQFPDIGYRGRPN